MQIFSFEPQNGAAVDRYGSVDLVINHLARLSGSGSIVVMHLGPGGKVGGHPASGYQVFMIAAGSGQVSGGDRQNQPIRAGQAALWQPGEWHETSTDLGLTAVVVESAQILLAK